MVREKALSEMVLKIQAISPASISLLKAFSENAQLRVIRRKATLLYEGGSQNVLWFLAQGFAREYQNDPSDWSETTNWFWQSGDFVFHEDFFNHERSEVSIDFYTDAILLELDLKDLLSDHSISGEVEEFCSILNLFSASQRKEHLLFLSKLTRMEHVKTFYNSHKLLFNFVRHRDLASFLKIKDKSIYRYLKGL